MCKNLILITLIMSSGIYAYSQDTINMVKILNIEQDIVALENRITSSIKVNNPDIANIQGLRQYHILWLNSYTDKKEDYLDHSFLYKLFFGYYELSPKVKKIKGCKPSLLYRINPDLYYYINSKRWKKFIRTTTLITDSTGNLVARGDARFVVGYTKFSQSDKELAKMFFEKEIDFAFCMGGQFGTYIGIKDDNLFALEETKEGLKIYSWEEFMKCCFDKWVYLRK